MRTPSRVRLFLATLVLALLGMVLLAGSASAKSASAWGCAWGNPNMGPTQYCVHISGSGNWVNSVTGNFNGSAIIGQWYITAEFFGTGWNWYQTLTGRMHYGQQTAGGDIIYVNARKYTGYMCSTLRYMSLDYGLNWTWHRMSVCHRINW